jgi:FKBP-type peptidyl-prolyl cis-trans isomerase
MVNPIQSGSHVTLHYTLALADGTIVDSTHGAEPIIFQVGSGALIEILESRLIGLRAGEQRRFEISAAQSQRAAIFLQSWQSNQGRCSVLFCPPARKCRV